MPLTESGDEVLASMTKSYGPKKGKKVFYASMNKGVKGSSKWHLRKAKVKTRAPRKSGI